MKTITCRRTPRGLVPAVALGLTLAAGTNAGATAPPSTPPESSAPDDTLVEATGDASAPGLPDMPPPGYVQLVDDTGLITVAVPESWTDVDTAPATNEDGSPQPWISAAPDFEQFQDTFDVPGVLYVAFPFEAEPQVLIDLYSLTAGCQSFEVEPYAEGPFTGVVQVGSSCGPDNEGTWNMIVANPPDESFTALVQLQTASPADQEAFDIVLQTFNVTPLGASGPGTSVPGSVPLVSVPPTDDPVAVTEAFVTAVQSGDAATACALLGPEALAEVAEDEASCEEQFLANADLDDPTVASLAVVGQAIEGSANCEPAVSESSAVVEVASDEGPSCVFLTNVDGRWLIDEVVETEQI